ncbi:hypothetical protein D3C80_1082600 [compost metagenome]
MLLARSCSRGRATWMISPFSPTKGASSSTCMPWAEMSRVQPIQARSWWRITIAVLWT